MPAQITPALFGSITPRLCIHGLSRRLFLDMQLIVQYSVGEWVEWESSSITTGIASLAAIKANTNSYANISARHQIERCKRASSCPAPVVNLQNISIQVFLQCPIQSHLNCFPSFPPVHYQHASSSQLDIGQKYSSAMSLLLLYHSK